MSKEQYWGQICFSVHRSLILLVLTSSVLRNIVSASYSMIFFQSSYQLLLNRISIHKWLPDNPVMDRPVLPPYKQQVLHPSVSPQNDLISFGSSLLMLLDCREKNSTLINEIKNLHMKKWQHMHGLKEEKIFTNGLRFISDKDL